MQDALQAALDKIAEDGREAGALIAADKARETTVTASITMIEGIYAGETLTFTLTGIAPFWPAETVGPLSGRRCWTVLGQEYASKSGLRSTRYSVVTETGEKLFVPPALSHREACRLADAIRIALTQPSPAIINTKAA